MTIIRGGAGAGTVTSVDLRGASKTTTSSATSGGGTATGTISVGKDAGTCIYLKITANSATTNSNFEFYRDTAKTDQVYQALNKDANTSAFVDATPWSLITASNLDGQNLQYTITNNGGVASTYDIEMWLIAE